jgi:hypothetical protein
MATLDTQLQSFFEATLRGYELAASRQPELTLDLSLAERPVRLRLADKGLAPLSLPLSHLRREAGFPVERPELEVFAWAGPGDWRPPAPPWDFDQLSWFGEIAGLKGERFSANYTADFSLLCLYDRETRRAIFWLPDAENLPFWEWAAPFRILFHWWSRDFGGQICHAAAVGHGGRGALLVGRGGSGKSTTSIACVEAGMEFVGDDYVLLTRSPVPMAHSLYNSAKIHTKFLHSALAPWSKQVVRQIGPERKSVLMLDQCALQQVRRSLPIAGVFQPTITTNTQAAIVPQSAAQGLLSMAPSTMYQLPEARQETLSLLAEWARSVPSYSLRLGTDLSSAPAVLKQWLATKEVRLAS